MSLRPAQGAQSGKSRKRFPAMGRGACKRTTDVCSATQQAAGAELDDISAAAVYRKELLRLERTLPSQLLSPDWSEREADWASVRATAMEKSLNRDVGDFGWEIAHAAVSRRPPISLARIIARTEGYTYAANVWDVSIVQGPFSVAPCQTFALRFAILSSLHARCTTVRVRIVV
jgi:hypothetical protein